MRRASAIGELVLHLNREARAEGLIFEEDEEATQLLATIRRGLPPRYRTPGAQPPEAVTVGMELRTGSTDSRPARRIREYALAHLAHWSTFLRAADILGYTPQVVRAALMIHYPRLEQEAIGTDGNCILVDLQQGAALLDQQERKEGAPRPSEVVAMLAAGKGPQEVGTHYGVNGSRLVGQVLKQLSLVLEQGEGRR